MRIEYDDHALTILEKVNEALKEHGLEFRDDGKDHDGYVIFMLLKNGAPETRTHEDGECWCGDDHEPG